MEHLFSASVVNDLVRELTGLVAFDMTLVNRVKRPTFRGRMSQEEVDARAHIVDLIRTDVDRRIKQGEMRRCGHGIRWMTGFEPTDDEHGPDGWTWATWCTELTGLLFP